MKRTESFKRFWIVLTSSNVLAIFYPLVSLLQAKSDAGQFLSAVVVVTVAFILGLIDTVAIFIAYVM